MIELRVVEGVSGNWFYHLSDLSNGLTALCGKGYMMPTSINRRDWGMMCGNSSIRYRWCKECASLSDGAALKEER